MNRCLECGIGAGEKIIYNVRCEHYKLFFLFLIKLAFRKPTRPSLNLKRSSKTHPSFLNLKFFLKSTRPSLPLKKAPPLFPSPFSHGEGWLHSAI